MLVLCHVLEPHASQVSFQNMLAVFILTWTGHNTTPAQHKHAAISSTISCHVCIVDVQTCSAPKMEMFACCPLPGNHAHGIQTHHNLLSHHNTPSLQGEHVAPISFSADPPSSINPCCDCKSAISLQLDTEDSIDVAHAAVATTNIG